MTFRFWVIVTTVSLGITVVKGSGCLEKCEPDGPKYLVHKKCFMYCVCVIKTPIPMLCPLHQHFSPILRHCVDPTIAKCSSLKAMEKDPECIGQCPEVEDPLQVVSLAHYNCNKYCVCKKGRQVVMDCSGGNYHFSLDEGKCLHPEQAKCKSINGISNDELISSTTVMFSTEPVYSESTISSSGPTSYDNSIDSNGITALTILLTSTEPMSSETSLSSTEPTYSVTPLSIPRAESTTELLTTPIGSTSSESTIKSSSNFSEPTLFKTTMSLTEEITQPSELTILEALINSTEPFTIVLVTFTEPPETTSLETLINSTESTEFVSTISLTRPTELALTEQISLEISSTENTLSEAALSSTESTSSETLITSTKSTESASSEILIISTEPISSATSMTSAIINFSTILITSTESSQVPEECPAVDPMHSTIHLAHESDCTKFYVCSNGRKIMMNCPIMDSNGNKLHFNPILQICDWPRNAGCKVN